MTDDELYHLGPGSSLSIGIQEKLWLRLSSHAHRDQAARCCWKSVKYFVISFALKTENGSH